MGTAGLFCTPVRKDAVSAEMSTAPDGAVPMDAPRLVTVFCTPPDFTALLIGHRGHGHGPQLGGQRADTETREQHRPGDDLRPGARIQRGQHDHDASEQAEEPGLPHPGGGETPAAASSSVSDSGSSRTPVATADSPSATDKNNGTAKNRPACRKYWKKNAVSPPRSAGFRSSAGSSSSGAATRETVTFPQKKPTA